jgi:poly-gamma-glutamate synthesis protein (capsule biosynthesis protein)
MTGRGIDQILPTSVNPRLLEPWVSSATTYVQLAEEQSGPIPQQVGFAYVWGDALTALTATRPDLQIINLETAVTDGGSPWPANAIL